MDRLQAKTLYFRTFTQHYGLKISSGKGVWWWSVRGGGCVCCGGKVVLMYAVAVTLVRVLHSIFHGGAPTPPKKKFHGGYLPLPKQILSKLLPVPPIRLKKCFKNRLRWLCNEISCKIRPRKFC